MARTGALIRPVRLTPCGVTQEQNAASLRRWFDEGRSQGNVNLADELYSPEYVRIPSVRQFSPTLDGLKIFIHALRAGIPDLQCPGGRSRRGSGPSGMAVRAAGTRDGMLLGSSHATVHRSDRRVMAIARFDERCKWIENWASWDQLGLLRRLGVVPAPAAA
jgi:hypothetical protein